MKAYVDESFRVAAPGLYVLGAVVVGHDQANEVRDALRGGLRHKRQRFHWREEEEGDRQAMAALVGSLDLVCVAALSTPINRHRPERARRRCLTRLMWELEQRQVLSVVFESRSDLDRSDRAHIANIQRARVLSPSLRYTFERPSQEPLLWLPDLVAGAVSSAAAGISAACLTLLDVSVLDGGSGT